MIRRCLPVLAVVSVALALSSPAFAHIDPDPKDAQAGARVTVGFTVEHGCDGSPTTQLDMRLPDGVTDAVPEPIDGWDESIDGNVITFVGGPLADDVEGTFDVTMTLPPTPDTTIFFPFVQRCEVGEIRWIGIPAEPGDELDEPAPAMNLFGPVAGPPPTTAPPTTTPATTPDQPATTDAPADTTPATTVATDTTEPPTTVPPTSVAAIAGAGDDGDDGGVNTGTIMFVASLAAVAVVAGLAYTRARSGRDPAPTT